MTGSTLKCHKALGFDCIALTHLYFSVALNMYIFSLYTFVASFGFKKSNWQNSHRFLLKTLRPLYHNEPFYKKKRVLFDNFANRTEKLVRGFIS